MARVGSKNTLKGTWPESSAISFRLKMGVFNNSLELAASCVYFLWSFDMSYCVRFLSCQLISKTKKAVSFFVVFI